jgi:hypothetical protein
VNKNNLRWVKIQEAGINYNTQVWAQQDLINQGNKWTVKIPSSLRPGNYVFRHELLAYVSSRLLNRPKVGNSQLTS